MDERRSLGRGKRRILDREEEEKDIGKEEKKIDRRERWNGR